MAQNTPSGGDRSQRGSAGKPRAGGRPGGSRPGGTARPSGGRDGKPGAKPAGRPTGKPGAKPTGKSTGKPGAKPTGKPAGKPSGKPGERNDRGARPNAASRPDRAGRPERGGRPDRTSRTDGPNRPERDDRPRGPRLPDDVTAEELDPRVLNELRTLPEGLADLVAKYLVAADRALMADDIDAAREFVRAAKSRAGRVAAVREATGLVAYLAEDYAEAATELRAVRRMTGTSEYLAMLADCERGLGRPQKALELAKEGLSTVREPDARVELLLVAAGARADMGQLDAAVVMLQVPELTRLPKGSARARLQYAYSEFLAQAGRSDDALEWLAKAAESDVDGATDAADRLAGDDGVDLFDEDVED